MTIKHIKELIGYLISLFSILEIVFHLESFTVAQELQWPKERGETDKQ
jgi:hypothetical protein